MPHDLNVGIGGIRFGDVSKLSDEDRIEFERLKRRRKQIDIDQFNTRNKAKSAALVRESIANIIAQRELFGIFEHDRTPPPEPEEECFKFFNIFRMEGSTAPGAPPQIKVLTSSGPVRCQDVEALQNSNQIIEEITEDEIVPPDEIGKTLSGEKSKVVIPFNPSYTKNGVKVQLTQNVFKIEIKESLGFREV